MKTLFTHFCTAVFLFACFASAVPSWAAPASEKDADRIKRALAQNTQGRVVPSSVATTPIPGIFEVASGKDVFYVDATGRYGFVEGRMIDMVETRDLTQASLEALQRIDFDALPFDLAIKEVHGTGRRRLAVFEDPGCPSCRALAKFIERIPDVTVYRFVFPVTEQASIPKAKAAWCAPGRAQAWAALMRGGLPPAPRECDTSGIERIVALGDELHIEGTPTVFLGDGRRLVGATPPDQFMEALDASTKVVRPAR